MTITDGAAYALCNSIVLSGMESSHPAEARGVTSSNCYLLVEGEHALMVDTGFAVHQRALVAQLEQLLDERSQLALLPLRFGEFAGVCNVRPIAERFGATQLYGRFFGEPDEWLDFRPDLDAPGAPGGGLAELRSVPTPADGRIAVDPVGRRVVEILVAPVRLLPEPWAYDHRTRTLFTGDLFGWVDLESEGSAAVLQESDEDATTVEAVGTYLERNRFWWLAGGDTESLRNGMSSLAERLEIETIAPGNGRVLRGRPVVERHLTMFDEALAQAEQRPSVGVAAGTWPFGG